MIEDILAYNRQFVADKGYEQFATDKYPNKKLAIVTCMDTRLIELLPAALDIKNGDAKIIKNAGGVISSPFGSAMRSLLIAIYELGCEEIMVIGHTDCGVSHIDSDRMIEEMKARASASTISTSCATVASNSSAGSLVLRRWKNPSPNPSTSSSTIRSYRKISTFPATSWTASPAR